MLCARAHKTARERNKKQGEKKERVRDVKSIKQNGQTKDKQTTDISEMSMYLRGQN